VSGSKRGLVLGSPWLLTYVILSRNEAGQYAVSDTTFMPAHDAIARTIRRGLLYFDEVALPNNNLLPTKDPLASLLTEQEIIFQPTWRLSKEALNGTHPASLIWRSHLAMFEHLERAAPGKWTMAPLGDETTWPEGPIDLGQAKDPEGQSARTPVIHKYRGAEIELHAALPVPRDDVPIAELLEFKERREPELLQLRVYIDELQQQIVTSHDVPRSRIVAAERLEKSLADVAAALDTSPVKWVMDSLRIDVVYDMGFDIAKAAGTAAVLGVPEPIGLAVGTGRALMRFKEKMVASPIKRAGPLAYAYHAQREGVANQAQ
jgi:hypothetical protein